MSREIKFRAWDNENKCFFRDTNKAYENVIEQLFISPAGDINLRKMDGMYHESTFPGRFVLQQYTGLKDRHGAEMFEGDIVKGNHINFPIDWKDVAREIVGAVVYKPGMYRVVGKTKTSVLTDAGLHLGYEVIGNIYENPELLEVNP
jgi:uncharacterized phage protein (TIGR01671 family)